MWKNNHMPKLMKTQLLTSVLLFACFLLVIGSYSWFSNNRKTDGKENQIITEEESDAILGDYTIFMRSTKEGSDGNTIKYEVLNSLEDVTLSAYDSVFGRNTDTAVILRIPVSGRQVDGKQALSFTMSRANTDKLSEYCYDKYGLKAKETNTDLHIEENKIINYLTNIAAFKFAIIPSLNDYKSTKENAQKIYEEAEAVFHREGNSIAQYTFAKQTKSGKIYTVTKTTNEITWNLGADYGKENLTKDEILYVYVEIDYEKYLIAAYLQNHEENFAVGKLGQTQFLSFVGDLSMLEVTPVSAQ